MRVNFQPVYNQVYSSTVTLPAASTANIPRFAQLMTRDAQAKAIPSAKPLTGFVGWIRSRFSPKPNQLDVSFEGNKAGAVTLTQLCRGIGGDKLSTTSYMRPIRLTIPKGGCVLIGATPLDPAYVQQCPEFYYGASAYKPTGHISLAAPTYFFSRMTGALIHTENDGVLLVPANTPNDPLEKRELNIRGLNNSLDTVGGACSLLPRRTVSVQVGTNCLHLKQGKRPK